MKKVLLLTILSVLSMVSFAQTNLSCCAIDATTTYSRNAADKSFVMSHDEPLPFQFVSELGKDLYIKTATGKDAHVWEVKAAKPTPYYIFVIHEWWGMNDYIKQEAEKLSRDLGVNAIAIDLYDGVIASTQEEAGKAMQSVNRERAEEIIKATFTYAGSKAKVFTIGWCFGGGWSLQSTLIGGKQSVGCIMYYGQPEKNVDRLKTLNADVLGFFGNLDQWPSPKVVDEFAENMKLAGKQLFLHRYEAPHAFANPSNPRYNKEATEDAYTHVLAFIKERIK
jgi:carboxymethylenebutenolidase